MTVDDVQQMDAEELRLAVRVPDADDGVLRPRLAEICRLVHTDPCSTCDRDGAKPCSLLCQCRETWWSCADDCPVYAVTGSSCSRMMTGTEMIDCIRKQS